MILSKSLGLESVICTDCRRRWRGAPGLIVLLLSLVAVTLLFGFVLALTFNFAFVVFGFVFLGARLLGFDAFLLNVIYTHKHAHSIV